MQPFKQTTIFTGASRPRARLMLPDGGHDEKELSKDLSQTRPNETGRYRDIKPASSSCSHGTPANGSTPPIRQENTSASATKSRQSLCLLVLEELQQGEICACPRLTFCCCSRLDGGRGGGEGLGGGGGGGSSLNFHGKTLCSCIRLLPPTAICKQPFARATGPRVSAWASCAAPDPLHQGRVDCSRYHKPRGLKRCL